MSKNLTKPWLYEGKPFTHDDVPEGAFGFIYCMELEVDGELKRYIGKKQIHSNNRVKKGKRELAAMEDKRGSKHKIVTRPNFEKYFSSNATIKELAKQGVPIKRVILKLCYSKMELTYQEIRYQFKLDVIEHDNYLNDNILGKFYKSKIQNDVRNKTNDAPVG